MAKAPREEVPPASAAAAKPGDEGAGGVIGYLRSVGPAIAVALLIRAFLFEPFSIPSGSMLPTLQIGDYVIVTKFAYGVRIPFTNRMLWQAAEPARGDVIVFDHPIRNGEDLIKRIVGLPGDVVELRDGVVFVNEAPQASELLDPAYTYQDYAELERRWFPGRARLFVEQLESPGVGPTRHYVLQQGASPLPDGPFRVPDGALFVLGDNRDNSADSRSMGGWFVPFGNVRGRADLIGFSWGEKGLRTDRLFRRLDSGVPGGR